MSTNASASTSTASSSAGNQAQGLSSPTPTEAREGSVLDRLGRRTDGNGYSQPTLQEQLASPPAQTAEPSPNYALLYPEPTPNPDVKPKIKPTLQRVPALNTLVNGPNSPVPSASQERHGGQRKGGRQGEQAPPTPAPIHARNT
ncbi:hypothetical protein Moror_13413 [Moniliophthora roreri MCA 2997]|uniref:Uncharacterized protein n=1 Tax=Moniliophthora roreri (strain MCA 2997) TaxID=1381753 RepID=V2WPA7_MONRO|nr:hypothetical protein Moror_13413 [Moniliophthora roreri MCA 2997]